MAFDEHNALTAITETRRWTVHLARGQSAENPACTTCRIWGPCEVTYTRYPDGGVDAVVRYSD